MKKSRVVLKAAEVVGEKDYRGFIALTLVVGLVAILYKGDAQAAAIIAPLAGSAVSWYFAKSKRGG